MRWRDGGLALFLLMPGVASAGLLPDMTIGYSYDFIPVTEGSTVDLPVAVPGRVAHYTWGGGAAIGALYQGTFQGGAILRGSHFLGSSGSKDEYSENFPAQGEYFVVIHPYPWWANVAWFESVNQWFKGGTATYPGSFPPDSWGIIRFRVGPVSQPPAISTLGQFRKFGVAPIDPGATFVGNEAVFKATVTDSDSAMVRLEIEVKPLSVAFDGTGIFSSATSSLGEISVPVSELIPVSQQYAPGGNEGAFHWRARAVDGEGNVSAWVEYGADALAADFATKVVPLWTQIQSEYPSNELTQEWATRPYASGYDPDCSRADPTNARIANCGCALTSAVMIARYFGVSSALDGSLVTPLALNEWLNVNEGYVGMNNVNWAKVEEYLGTRIAGEPHKRLALDYAHFKTRSRDVVNGALAAETPVIAFSSAAGHYFVLDSLIAAPGGETYTVRDPRWYNTKTLNDAQDLAREVKGYGNSFTHGTIFRKLETPQRIAAHVELYLASPAEILVTDSEGRRSGRDPRVGVAYDEIPGSRYVYEDRIVTSDTDIEPSDYHTAKVLLLPELIDATYRVEIIGTGDGPYTLTAVMTDGTGSTTSRVESETTSAGDVSGYAFSVSGGVPSDFGPTRKEILTRLEVAVRPYANLDAQLRTITRTSAEGKTGTVEQLIETMLKGVMVLERRGAMDAATADTISGLLRSLRDTL